MLHLSDTPALSEIVQSGDSVTGWFAALWHPQSSHSGLYTELPERTLTGTPVSNPGTLGLCRAMQSRGVFFEHAASAGPAVLGPSEQPLKRIPALERAAVARHLENPSL